MLTRAGVEDAMRPRRSRPLFLIDIAVPRDVDPEAGLLDQVFLYNIDDLQAIVGENLARRTLRSRSRRRDRPTRKWTGSGRGCSRGKWCRPSSRCASASRRFARPSSQRLEPKMASMPPEARARVDEITHLLVEKLLLTPTEQLKAAEDQAQAVAYCRCAHSPVQPDGPPKRNPGELMKPVRIGTRGSALALWQAHTVAALLERAAAPARSASSRRPAIACRTRRSPKRAARDCSSRKSRTRCSAATIDLAVHSAKDMSVGLPDGLDVAAVLPREDSRDALVLPHGADARLGAARRGDRHGQRAPQRAAARAPSRTRDSFRFEATWTRGCGNSTRGEFDALVLAVAGLKRLGHERRISVRLSHDECVPAPGQGIVAIETRARRRGDRRRAADDQ